MLFAHLPVGSAIVRHPEGIAALRFTMKAVREPDDAETPLIEVATAPTKRENSAGTTYHRYVISNLPTSSAGRGAAPVLVSMQLRNAERCERQVHSPYSTEIFTNVC